MAPSYTVKDYDLPKENHLMNHYEAKGIAAMLPGMLRVLECMDEEVERMLLMVNGRPPGRPPKHTLSSTLEASRTWEKMTKKQQRARKARTE